MGTATHLFLQFCDFEAIKKNGVQSELSRLIEKKYIPADSASLVFADDLEKFSTSSLYNKISRAKRVIREQRFNILLSPELICKDENFLKQTAGEFLAVQGVIDLIIEDENNSHYL